MKCYYNVKNISIYSFNIRLVWIGCLQHVRHYSRCWGYSSGQNRQNRQHFSWRNKQMFWHMLTPLRCRFGIIIERKWAMCGMDHIIFKNSYLYTKMRMWNDLVAILLPFSQERSQTRKGWTWNGSRENGGVFRAHPDVPCAGLRAVHGIKRKCEWDSES